MGLTKRMAAKSIVILSESQALRAGVPINYRNSNTSSDSANFYLGQYMSVSISTFSIVTQDCYISITDGLVKNLNFDFCAFCGYIITVGRKHP